MHEFNITKSLLDVAMAQAQLQPGERIQRLHITLDPNSGYTPESIRFYFDQLAHHSTVADAELVFELQESGQPIRLTQVDIAEMDLVTPPAAEMPTGERLDAPSARIQWQLEFNRAALDTAYLAFVNALLADMNLQGELRVQSSPATLLIQGQLDELAHFCHHLRHDAPTDSSLNSPTGTPVTFIVSQL